MHRLSRLTLIAVLVAIAAGCSNSVSPTQPSQPQTVTLAPAQSVTLASGARLTFDSVVADSRCATGNTCIWEGEVKVALTLSQAGAQAQFILSDHAPAQTVAGTTFTLVSVEPYPKAGESIPPAAYRATVRIAR